MTTTPTSRIFAIVGSSSYRFGVNLVFGVGPSAAAAWADAAGGAKWANAYRRRANGEKWVQEFSADEWDFSTNYPKGWPLP